MAWSTASNQTPLRPTPVAYPTIDGAETYSPMLKVRQSDGAGGTSRVVDQTSG